MGIEERAGPPKAQPLPASASVRYVRVVAFLRTDPPPAGDVRTPGAGWLPRRSMDNDPPGLRVTPAPHLPRTVPAMCDARHTAPPCRSALPKSESTTEAQRTQRKSTKEIVPLPGGDAERPGEDPAAATPFRVLHISSRPGDPSPVCPSSAPSASSAVQCRSAEPTGRGRLVGVPLLGVSVPLWSISLFPLRFDGNLSSSPIGT